ncbi:MAG: type II secretion system GspH family protein [Rhodobacteraceae bacterium]|jgi:general secretion pathway protein I|nr:type II secretion system GspH family protein [Paracoccaceae bacterium]
MRARLGLHRRAGGARGFSLVELVVAILVLSIGTVGALRAFQQAGRDTAGLTARQLALQVAQSRADEIRLLGIAEAGALPEEVEMGRLRFRVTLTRTPTRGGLVEALIAVAQPDGPGARLVAYFAAPGP